MTTEMTREDRDFNKLAIANGGAFLIYWALLTVATYVIVPEAFIWPIAFTIASVFIIFIRIMRVTTNRWDALRVWCDTIAAIALFVGSLAAIALSWPGNPERISLWLLGVALVTASVAVFSLGMKVFIDESHPSATPEKSLVQFALKATAIVASVGFLLIFAIVMFLPDKAPYPASQQYLVLFGLGGLSTVAMYNRRFGDNVTRGRRIAIKLTLLVVIVELILAGYTSVWLAISPKGTEIPWTQGLTWALTFLFTVVMLSRLGWFRKS